MSNLPIKNTETAKVSSEDTGNILTSLVNLFSTGSPPKTNQRNPSKGEKSSNSKSMKSINIDEVDILTQSEESAADEVDEEEPVAPAIVTGSTSEEDITEDIEPEVPEKEGKEEKVEEEEPEIIAEEADDVKEVEIEEPQEKAEEDEGDIEENKRATPPLAQEMQKKNQFVKAFERNFVDPIKRKTGIEEFDIWHLVVVIFVLLCFIMIATVPFMLTVMADTELGIGYSPFAATFQGGIIQSGGVRKKVWGGKVIRWPRTDQIIEFRLEDEEEEENIVDSRSQRIKIVPKLLCNSKDGLEIELSTIVHMRIIESEIKRLTKLYTSFDTWFSLVSRQIRSSTLHFCQNVTAFDFQGRREEIAADLEDFVRQELFNRFRADIRRVALINIKRPAEFEQAIVDLENTRSVITLADTEREGALIKANTLVDIAENEVVRILDTAQKDAEVRAIQALTVAEALLDRIEQFSVVFERVQLESQLNTTQTLSFIESLLLVDNLKIAVDAPVELNFKNDL